MSNSLSKHQRLISESNSHIISKKIEELEALFPVEIKFVVAEKAGSYKMGAVRFLVFIAIAIEAAAHYFWMPSPFWLLALLVLVTSFCSHSLLRNFGFLKFFATKEERLESIYERTTAQFEKLNIGSTDLKNAILVYLDANEKKFYVMPDSHLKGKISMAEFSSLVTSTGEAMKHAGKNESIFAGLLQFSKGLENILSEKFTKKQGVSNSPNQISNAIVFE